MSNVNRHALLDSFGLTPGPHSGPSYGLLYWENRGYHVRGFYPGANFHAVLEGLAEARTLFDKIRKDHHHENESHC